MPTNASTTMTTNRYFDELVLGFRQASAPMFNIFTLDASAKSAGRDQTITSHVFVPSGSSVTTYNSANGFVLGVNSRTGVAVTLNNYKYAGGALTQAEILESSIINIQQSARANVTEVVNDVFYNCLNHISASNQFPSFTTQTSSSVFTYSKLVDIRTTAVSTYKWNGPAYLVVNSQVFGALMKDSTIADAAKRGNNDVVTGTNLFRSIQNPGGGWNAIYEAPDIAFTNNVVGYAVTPSALVTALRYWEPPTGFNGQATAISDPNDPNGLTLGYREWVSPDYDETRAVVTALWGKTVVNPNGAILLKATSNT
jgi:hypothetical protein